MPNHPGRSPKPAEDKSTLRTVFVYLNLVIVAFMTVALVGVTRRINTTDSEKRVLDHELERTRATVDLLTRKHEEQLGDVMERETAVRTEMERRDEERNALIDKLAARLTTIESQNRQSKAEVTTSLKREIEGLKSELRIELGEKKDAATMFRDFETIYGRGVVLIYTEFDYYRVRDGKDGRKKTVTGWGSGFFVSEDGHIVTNKHVVQPWKFDQDLATMASLGEIRIDEDSLRIACWESGMRALAGEEHPSTSLGYNNFELKNLRIYAVAPDHMSDRSVDSGVFGPKFRVHDLDNNDLVILKAEGKDFCPLPCVDHAGGDTLKKLDSVMALGYPRGQNGLETSVVTTSPSIGTIRKVENTIHVTASIIPGNSGGPLIGPEGKVVGIVTRIYSETLGICIRIDHARQLIEEGKKSEKAALRLANSVPSAIAQRILGY